jgi:hypothetical protein
MSHAPDQQDAFRQADRAAATAHIHTDATVPHARLADSVWRLLHALGAPVGGRALAFGTDPQVFLTGDPDRRQARDADGFPRYDRWRGTIPPTGPATGRDSFPVTRYPLNLETAPPFDVVVASMAYNDVRLRSREARVQQHRAFHVQATEALTGLAPGGHAILVANHSVLDFPDPEPWARVARKADFLGAVRLPSHALRAAPACDAPMDVLVLRRRQGTRPDPGLRIPGVQWSPQDALHENKYFTMHPERVLGSRAVGTDHWGMKQLAVHDADHSWPIRLEAAFGEIAHQHGLGAAEASDPYPAPGRPALRQSSTRPREEPSGPEL